MALEGGIRGMQPLDIYVDEKGHEWEVVGYWTEPVVIMQRKALPGERLEHPLRKTAGISGLMWSGFKKLTGVTT